MNKGKPRSDARNTPWRAYERQAAMAEIEEHVGLDLTASANVRVFGVLSEAQRQIDLLIEPRWAHDLRARVIVDAKRYKRPLTVKDVEAFEGMMRDCRAEHGVLICSNGWSKAAARRAGELITLRHLSVDAASDTVEAAGVAECEYCYRHQPNPDSRGIVLWNGQLPLKIDGLFAIVWTGLCDACGRFQIWCWDCGSIFSIDEEPYRCECGRVWRSAAIPTTSHANDLGIAARLLVVQVDEESLAIDRRSF